MAVNLSVKTRGEKRQTGEPEKKVTNVTRGGSAARAGWKNLLNAMFDEKPVDSSLRPLRLSFATFAVKNLYYAYNHSKCLPGLFN
jgi:hypothetical protein